VIQELVYTSAPRGLKPGVKGFCTVECTAGMSPTVTDRLESLSGYRHLFAAHEQNARLNPVIFSHLKVKAGSSTLHVLSRICDAGLDYSQRSNKLAHHVALDASTLPPPGPAWLLAQSGFMKTSWAGEPTTVPADRKIPGGNPTPRVCQAWQQLTGDAGWAGVLAETALENPGRQAAIIFRPGMNTLPLVCEALSLLPPDHRWDVTFSTYFNKLPPDIDCQWRFLVDGEDEAKAARRNPQTIIIDLCHQLPKAQGGELVEAARTGNVIHRAVVRQTAIKRSGGATTSVADLSKQRSDQVRQPSHERALQIGGADRKPKQKSAVIVVGIMLLVLVVGGAFFAGSRSSQIALPPPPLEPSEDLETARLSLTPNQINKPAQSSKKPRRRRVVEDDDSQPTANMVAAAVPAPPVAKPTQAARKPFEDLKEKLDSPGYIELPPCPNPNASPADEAVNTYGELFKLYLTPDQQVKLELKAPTKDAQRQIKIQQRGYGKPEWIVEGVIEGGVALPDLLGAFTLKANGLLTYKWDDRLKSAMKPAILRWCQLIVQVDDNKSEAIPLRKPSEPKFDLKVYLAASEANSLALECSPFLRDDAQVNVEIIPSENETAFRSALESGQVTTIPLKGETRLVIPASSAGMLDLILKIVIKEDEQKDITKRQVEVTKLMVLPGGTNRNAKPISLSDLKDLEDAAAPQRRSVEDEYVKKLNKGTEDPLDALAKRDEALRFIDESERRYRTLYRFLEKESSDEPLLTLKFTMPPEVTDRD
jgi:hypothetical protein